MTVAAARSFRPQPLGFPRLVRDEAQRRGEDLLELMRRRRSVRHFSQDPVSPALSAGVRAGAGSGSWFEEIARFV